MTSARTRISRLDVTIALLVSGLGVVLMIMNVEDLQAGTRGPEQQAAIHIGNLLPLWTAVPLFLLVTAPLLWRRVAPLAAAGAALAGLVLNLALVGSEFVRCGVLLPTVFLLAYAAGARLDRRHALIGLGLSGGLAVLDLVVEFDVATAAMFSVVTAVMWGVGRVVHARGVAADELRARTAELRRARDERARLEVAADRSRLSRELGELLHRQIGAIGRLADEGARADDPAAATALFAEIEDESRSTLEAMRTAVGVLRADTPLAPTAPQPTLTHLESLLARAKGGDARLTVEGGPRALPAAVELSAYRIVEQLLDALEDAPDVTVGVRFRDDAVELAVSGPAGRSARAAIERARERARLQRGTFEATVRGGRAEALVSLPVLVVA